MLTVKKKVRPQPAVTGPSVADGLAVSVVSCLSVRLNTPAETRAPSSPSGSAQSTDTSWPVQDLNSPLPSWFLKPERQMAVQMAVRFPRLARNPARTAFRAMT